MTHVCVSVWYQVAQLKKCLKYEYTDQEVVDLVAEKKRFQKNPSNFAVRKHELMKEKVCHCEYP